MISKIEDQEIIIKSFNIFFVITDIAAFCWLIKTNPDDSGLVLFTALPLSIVMVLSVPYLFSYICYRVYPQYISAILGFLFGFLGLFACCILRAAKPEVDEPNEKVVREFRRTTFFLFGVPFVCFVLGSMFQMVGDAFVRSSSSSSSSSPIVVEHQKESSDYFASIYEDCEEYFVELRDKVEQKRIEDEYQEKLKRDAIKREQERIRKEQERKRRLAKMEFERIQQARDREIELLRQKEEEKDRIWREKRERVLARRKKKDEEPAPVVKEPVEEPSEEDEDVVVIKGEGWTDKQWQEYLARKDAEEREEKRKHQKALRAREARKRKREAEAKRRAQQHDYRVVGRFGGIK